MLSIKKQMKKIIEDQPEDASYDEILRELTFARMIERGVKDSDKGRVIKNENLKRQIKSW